MRITPLRLIALLFVASILPAKAQAVSLVRHQLNATLPEVKFDGVALNDAIDFLRDVSGANITVNWKALEGAGVAKDTTLNIKLRSVPLRRALDLVLNETAGSGKIGYTVDENVIEITTQELIDSRMYTRVYPVEDLIMEIPDFTNAPDFNLSSTATNSSQNGGGSGSGSGSGIFNSTGNSSNNTEKGKTKSERANDLMDLIRSVVQPEIWVENGGKAVIRYYNGNLIVTAPRSVQEAIGGQFD